MDNNSKSITEEKAYARMARVCSQKECAPSDILRKLLRLELSEEVAKRVVDRLKRERYLDDKRFVRSYINDKLHFNKWGKRKIALFLKQKNFSQSLIDEVFAEFTDDSMNQSLRPLLEKKWKNVTAKSTYEKRTKLIRYALGRGFSMEAVLNCLREMEIEEEFDERE